MSNIISIEALAILNERFGCDSLIALGTVDGTTPHVRAVNSYYENGAFYVVTHALSNKMTQIEKNPTVAICGEWFTANALGENIGHVRAPENAALAVRLRDAFSSWYGNGHVDESDPHTCILRLCLTDGILMHHGTRHELIF